MPLCYIRKCKTDLCLYVKYGVYVLYFNKKAVLLLE